MFINSNHFIFSYSLTIPKFFFFFFNDTATTEIYTLSLHDALPISRHVDRIYQLSKHSQPVSGGCDFKPTDLDRKSTRLNSSHVRISYAVFCLKKKKKKIFYTNLNINKKKLYNLHINR